jgi:putative oxidoreductase
MRCLRFVARLALAWIFVISGYDVLRRPERRADLVAKTVPLPEPQLLVRINGGMMVAGGTALALGLKPRLAALELAATLVPTTYVGHQFWKQSDPAARRMQKVHFDKNVGLFGGLLAYALTEGN